MEFKFKELFTQHLLWDGSRGQYAIEANGAVFQVEAIAEKKGLAVLVCTPASGHPFPGSADRKRIEREVSKLHHEHVIVFVDLEHNRQIWQVPRREGGKTTGHSEIPYFKGKGVEHLARRLEALSLTLEESESISLVEVAARVNQALLAERVTKKFFKEFSDQRKAFVKFLDWIADESKRDWYCSVLLNRLMFIYFLGGKGFLPGGTSFLSINLAANITANGADTFYTRFLLPLSFFGLGERKGNRGRFEGTFKDVLYLDGGLFTVHQVERELGLNKEAVEKGVFPGTTKIPDAEFKRWFAYFDNWRWTLDEDKVENEGYISPHILGYIFEKYINQKQMGAYYTKEDITGYICRNTIIPRLFDMLAETGEKGKKSVHPLPIGPHPNLLNDGRGISEGEGIDRYVYASVKQESRLPTETDYEQEQRVNRYESILSDFDTNKIQSPDDFITYNLDIEKLALDFVSNIQDPEVLHAFYFKGLQQITVLDPTCGSGAFLFEALIILYPLYNACLSRMRYLVGKATGAEPDVVNWGGRLHFDDLGADQSTLVDAVPAFPGGSKILDALRAEVERINDHPSAEYFIKKTIIVNNLFGVDIMEEAVEICKLRLFLTLIATLDRDDSKDNFGVEPLPDIDFNILAGNTLVGYTSIADIDGLWHQVELGSSTLAFEKDHSRLKKLVEEYGKVLKAWRLQQLGEWSGAPVSKDQVLRAVESVRPDLDEDLWRLYRTAGLATKEVKATTGKTKKVELTQADFKRSHEPFHWLLEFPSIEAAGGFDAIVGNPPYVEWSSTNAYSAVGFKTADCGNLYPWVLERAARLASASGFVGMIIPLGGFATARMSSYQKLLKKEFGAQWVSHFSGDAHPSMLFAGVKYRLSIFVGEKRSSDSNPARFSSGYMRWYASERETLFERLAFTGIPQWSGHLAFARLASRTHVEVLEGMLRHSLQFGAMVKKEGPGSIQYHRSPSFWIRALNFEPYFESSTRNRSDDHVRDLYFADQETADAAGALLVSTFFYIWFQSQGNCRDLTTHEVLAFPIPNLSDEDKRLLAEQFRVLMEDVKAKSRVRTYNYAASGVVRYQEFYLRQSATQIQQIDRHLARLYGISDEARHWVNSYDLKYRIGDSEEESE